MSELENRRRVTVTKRMLYGAGSGALLLVSLGCWIAYAAGGTWSDAAGWVEALATVAAFGAAIVAALLVGRTLELELHREDQRLRTDRSVQAALVTAWPGELMYRQTSVRLPGAQVLSTTRVDGVRGCHVWVRNASQAPVTNITIRVTIAVMERFQEPGPHPTQVSLATPTLQKDYLPPSAEDALWPVGSSEYIPIPDLYARDLEPDEFALDIDFLFTDAAGVHWHRGLMGLHERTSACVERTCRFGAPEVNLNVS